MQKILVLLFALSLGACKENKTTESTEPKTAQRVNTAQNYSFSVRYDGNEDINALTNSINENANFKNKYNQISLFVENANTKRISELPSLSNLDNRITAYLSEFQGHKTYQEVSNYVLFLAVKGYFIRIGNLDNNQKAVLGKYLDILVAQKNMELTELAWSLEQMKGVWEASKIRQTAQTIITQYDSWANTNKTAVNQVAEVTTSTEDKEVKDVKTFYEETQAEFQKDEAARILLVQLSNFQ